MFDAEQLCIDYSIEFWTEGKNTRPGWIQIQCPFCDDDSNHGGINTDKSYYNCWKCGFHPLPRVLQEVLSIRLKTALELIAQYSQNKIRDYLNDKKEKPINTFLELPPGTTDLFMEAKKYLKSRNFDWQRLEHYWDLKATKFTGPYKFRIIAPIYVNERLISFQGRDYTGKQELRYKTCPIEKEIIHHKDIVYGIDLVQNKKAILVEGITDAWRLGPGAVATFGTSYKTAQINFIAENINELFMLYDPEEDAQKRGEKLSLELSALGVKVEMVDTGLNCDPGDMNQNESDYLRQDLLGY